MSKQIGYTIQDKITAAMIPQPFEFDYGFGDKLITISVNPMLSLNERKSFCEAVWAMYYSPDKEGDYDLRTYTREYAIRLFALYFMTNIKFDVGDENGDIMRHYNFVMYTDVYDKFLEQLDTHRCFDYYSRLLNEVSEYLDRKCFELNNLRDFAVKNQIDLLIEDVLNSAKLMLDRVANETNDIDVKDLLSAVSNVKEAIDDESFVKNILDYRFGKEGSEKDGVAGTEV